MKKLAICCAAMVLTLAASSCATLQQLTALRQVDFALDGIRGARIAGVALDRIASYDDLSMLEVGRLALAVTRKNVPLEFQAVVLAENPSGNAAAATLTQLSWTLLLDDTETISGGLDRAYTMAPGESISIPLQVSLNLIEFFDGSAESLLNLASNLAGADADPTKVAMSVVPTIDTPLGPISYPRPITVVSRTIGQP